MTKYELSIHACVFYAACSLKIQKTSVVSDKCSLFPQGSHFNLKHTVKVANRQLFS